MGRWFLILTVLAACNILEVKSEWCFANATFKANPSPGNTCNDGYCYCAETTCIYQCITGCQTIYWGPYCANRRGQMKYPPTVVSTCAGITVSFRAINLTYDFGTPPEANYKSYVIVIRTNSTNTSNYATQVSSGGDLSMSFKLATLSKSTTYAYAIMPIYTNPDPSYTESGIYSDESFSAPVYPTCLDVATSNVSVNIPTLTWSQSGQSDAVSAVITYQAIRLGDCQTLVTSPVVVEVPYSQLQYNLTLNSTWTVYQVSYQLKDAFNQTGAQLSLGEMTSPEAMPTGQVQSLTVTATTTNSLTFTWQPPPCATRNGKSVGYFVEVRGALPGGGVSSGVLDKPQPIMSGPIVASQLLEGILYNISVSYVNSIGSGPAVVIQSRTLVTTPGAPTALVANSVTTNSITLSWNAPDGTVYGTPTSYTIQYTASGGSPMTMSGSTTTQTITNLTPSTTYTVLVSATYSGGRIGPQSNAITVTTAAIVITTPTPTTTVTGVTDQVTNLRVNLVAEGNIRRSDGFPVIWDAPQYTPSGKTRSGYRVRIQPTSSSASVTTFSLPIGQLSHNFTGLTFSTAYNVMVDVMYTDNSFGSTATLTQWTVSPPFAVNATWSVVPSPRILEVGPTAIKLQVFSVTGYSGTVSTFGVIYYVDTATRTRRDAPDADLQGKLGVPSNSVLVYRINGNPANGTVLDIGSGQSLSDSLSNPALAPGTQYNFRTFVTSVTDSYVVAAPAVSVNGNTNSNTLNGGIIAAIVLFILLCLLLLALLIWWLWRRRRQRGPVKERLQNMPVGDLPKLVYVNGNQAKFTPRFFTNWSPITEVNEARHLIVDLRFGTEKDVKLQQVLDEMARNGKSFEEEFHSLSTELQSPCRVASRPENRRKNFDPNERLLIPYDHRRVILKRPDGSRESDYINATFFNGYLNRRTYIVAQSPFNTNTTADFWLMIYQQNVAQVVMLCECEEDNQRICESYWPKWRAAGENENQNGKWFGSVLVRLVSVEEYAHFTVRRISIALSSTEWSQQRRATQQTQHSLSTPRSVIQYHFHGWPYGGLEQVPDSTLPLLELHTRLGVDRQLEDGPVVLHCDKGIGRTAVLLAFDTLLQQGVRENCVNVFNVVREMRRQRPLMLASPEMYMFLYDLLGEALMVTHSVANLDVRDLYSMLATTNPRSGRTFLEEQHCLLEHYTPLVPPLSNSHILVRQKWIRYQTVVPSEAFRVQLTSRSIINAIWVDGLRNQGQYILAETPSKTTLADFWDMIEQNQVSIIVDMEPYCYGQDDAVAYVPEVSDPGRDVNVGSVTVSLKGEEDLRDPRVKVRHFLVKSRATGATRVVRVFQFMDNWDNYKSTPVSSEGLVALVAAVRQDHERGPLLVHCLDGASRSGLFIVAHLCVDKLVEDRFVDVFHTIKAVKLRRSQVISHFAQHQLVYRVLWRWVSQFMMQELREGVRQGTLVGHLHPDVLESSFTYATAALVHQHREDGTASFNASTDLHSLYTLEDGDGIRPTLLGTVHYKYADEELRDRFAKI